MRKRGRISVAILRWTSSPILTVAGPRLRLAPSVRLVLLASPAAGAHGQFRGARPDDRRDASGSTLPEKR